MDVTAVLNMVAGAPLHAILIVAIWVLWKRVEVLELRLEECLKSDCE